MGVENCLGRAERMNHFIEMGAEHELAGDRSDSPSDHAPHYKLAFRFYRAAFMNCPSLGEEALGCAHSVMKKLQAMHETKENENHAEAEAAGRFIKLVDEVHKAYFGT